MKERGRKGRKEVFTGEPRSEGKEVGMDGWRGGIMRITDKGVDHKSLRTHQRSQQHRLGKDVGRGEIK